MDFFKYNSNGNDFIILDDRKDSIESFLSKPFNLSGKKRQTKKESQIAKNIQKLCSRQFYIGADGLILLQTSKVADFKMKVFNSDGFEADMCGNALLCLAKFIHDFIDKKNEILIETKVALYKTYLKDSFVSFTSKKPKILKTDYKINIESKNLNLQIVNSGVFHGVTFVDNIKDIDVFKMGQKIRYLKDFAPHGVNVNFCEILKKNEIKVRTYEKGVEDETYCCLTGAIAVANAYKRKKDVATLLLHFKGGNVIVQFENDLIKLSTKPFFAYKGLIS
ncbi:MAG: Diaminopimelate epimerase [Candidatus Anoxychlamydiales bacterium]|nr:Diaminopimelate epimerase [Candidatus Anoxychlamydiales bacterium]NGX35670.1 Diaminopimelate epimerase [Candidatus Anoxychlamydiales bacterium]